MKHIHVMFLLLIFKDSCWSNLVLGICGVFDFFERTPTATRQSSTPIFSPKQKYKHLDPWNNKTCLQCSTPTCFSHLCSSFSRENSPPKSPWLLITHDQKRITTRITRATRGWHRPIWIGSSPQLGANIQNTWNHQVRSNQIYFECQTNMEHRSQTLNSNTLGKMKSNFFWWFLFGVYFELFWYPRTALLICFFQQTTSIMLHSK